MQKCGKNWRVHKMEELLGTISPLIEKEENETKSLHWSLKWLVRIVALSLIIFSFMMESFGPITSLIILFILVVPLEKIFPRHKGQPVRRKHWRLDINYALAAPAIEINSCPARSSPHERVGDRPCLQLLLHSCHRHWRCRAARRGLDRPRGSRS